MRKSILFALMALVVVMGLLAAQCPAPAPTVAPTQAPQPTQAVQPTKAPVPTQTPAPTPTTAPKPVTVNWWHIQSVPGVHQTAWQEMADAYHVAHPNVTIKITILENEAFKTKLTTVMQSGSPPDLFQSWGGGTMNEYAKAGLLKDITADVKGAWGDSIGAGALAVYSYKGVQYGVPWDMGVVGFWYNKQLFAKAGITAPPATWSEFLDVVKKLKAAGITPISLGEGDKWPGAFWWEYLAVRIGGKPAFDAAYSRTGSFADPTFVQAGEKLKELIALDPFPKGYQGLVHNDQEAIMGNGEAAMQLMGQWAPGAMIAGSTTGKGIGDENVGFFMFPGVEGGAGGPTDALGGGNGICVGKNASPEAVDFLRFLTNVTNQSKLAELAVAVPVVKGAEKALKDPNMVTVSQAVSAAKYFQLYYDQYMPPAVGSAVNDAVQGIFAGTMTPEQAAKAVEASAAKELK